LVKKEAFNTEMIQYKRELKKWQKKQAKQKDAFRNTPEFKEALKRREVLYQKNLDDYKKAVKLWKVNHKKIIAMKGDDMDKLGVTTKTQMDNYVFTFNELSWINVDRFYHLSPQEKQVIALQTDKIEEERVLIMFNNISSMISMSRKKNSKTYYEENFPKQEPAVIFAYKVVDGKAMLCYQIIDGAQKYQLNYEPTTFAEIKAILSQFEENRRS